MGFSSSDMTRRNGNISTGLFNNNRNNTAIVRNILGRYLLTMLYKWEFQFWRSYTISAFSFFSLFILRWYKVNYLYTCGSSYEKWNQRSKPRRLHISLANRFTFGHHFSANEIKLLPSETRCSLKTESNVPLSVETCWDDIVVCCYKQWLWYFSSGIWEKMSAIRFHFIAFQSGVVLTAPTLERSCVKHGTDARYDRINTKLKKLKVNGPTNHVVLHIHS